LRILHDKVFLEQFFPGLDVTLRHVKATLIGEVVLIEVRGSKPEPFDVRRRQAGAVVAHVLATGHVNGQDFEPIRVAIDQAQNRDLQFGRDARQEHAGGNIRLTLGSDDDTRVSMIKAIFLTKCGSSDISHCSMHVVRFDVWIARTAIRMYTASFSTSSMNSASLVMFSILSM
jgi:hypothetical protein